MTVYERVKYMTLEEMQSFMYWVYMNGNADGMFLLRDSVCGYFGGSFLTFPEEAIFPEWEKCDPLSPDEMEKRRIATRHSMIRRLKNGYDPSR